MRAGYVAPLRPRISIKTSNFILKFAVTPIVHVPCRRACLRSRVISPASSLCLSLRFVSLASVAHAMGVSLGGKLGRLFRSELTANPNLSQERTIPRSIARHDRRDVREGERGKSCVGNGTAARRKTVCQEVVN